MYCSDECTPLRLEAHFAEVSGICGDALVDNQGRSGTAAHCRIGVEHCARLEITMALCHEINEDACAFAAGLMSEEPDEFIAAHGQIHARTRELLLGKTREILTHTGLVSFHEVGDDFTFRIDGKDPVLLLRSLVKTD